MKWQHKLSNTPKPRLPAIAYRALWEIVAKGRAGIWWETIEGYKREPIRDTVHRYVCGVQDTSKRKGRNEAKASA